MNAIRFPTPLPTTGHSAPDSKPIPTVGSAWRPLILKLYHTHYSLDPYADRLYSHGYDVVNTLNYLSTLKAAREFHPAMIIVHDTPAEDVDALEWIGCQHGDHDPHLAMIPLVILAEAARVPTLKIEALPDRIIILQNRADTLNQLTRTVKRTLRVWGLDQGGFALSESR
jgi:hypothetical protein